MKRLPVYEKTILIVDDSPIIIARMLEMLTEIPGIDKVVAARDYAEAVAVFSAGPVNIMLVDLHLPGKNGIELLRYVTKNFSGTASIVVSNMTNSYYRKACREAGAKHFIDKSKAFDLLPEILIAAAY